jgi:hypothetical protein
MGLSVNGSGNSKTINNERYNFRTTENIYTLIRLEKLQNINSFRIKQEIYNRSNNSYVRNSESNIYRPYDNYWAESYIENNLGRLSSGEYYVKTSIKINNEAYKFLEQRNFSVDNNNYNNNYDSNYNYSGTYSDNNLRHDGGYVYSLDNPKTNFKTNENVVVLTKLSEIRNVNTLQIKHEFFQDGRNRYKTLVSPVRNPNGAYWEYNYSYNNFGTMPEGNHTIKVFIKINNGNWKQIDTVSVNITKYGSTSNNYYNNYNSNYIYDGTKTGDQISATTNPSTYYAYQ